MDRETAAAPFKLQAKRLRAFLAAAGVELKQRNALEAVAQMYGHANYQALIDAPVADAAPDHSGESLARIAIDAALEGTLDTLEPMEFVVWQGLRAAQPAATGRDAYAFEEIALYSARIVLNPFDVEAMAAALPYLHPDGHYSSWRADATGILEHSLRASAQVRFTCTPIVSQTLAPIIGETRYRLMGALAMGSWEERNYVDAAAWATMALADGNVTDDYLGLGEALPVLLMEAGLLAQAAEAAEAGIERDLLGALEAAERNDGRLDAFPADALAALQGACLEQAEADDEAIWLDAHDGPLDCPVMDGFWTDFDAAIMKYVRARPELGASLANASAAPSGPLH